MSGTEAIEAGPAAASIAQMVVDLAETADRFGRDWRPTLAQFIQLRLERFSPLPAMSEWQDISTAPTDGTEIDVWALAPDGVGRRVVDVCWTRMTDWDGREFEGWTGMYPVRFGDRHEPTHWMPRPPAPTPNTEAS